MTSVDEDVKKISALIYCCWEHKTDQPLWKTIWQFLKMLNIELALWNLSDSTPRYMPKRAENIYPYKNLFTNIYSSIIHKSEKIKKKEQSQMSIN